jgi:cytohesin
VLASLTGELPAVDALLGSGVDVNERDRYGRTALHAAALSGDVEMAAHLLALGADPNAREDAEESVENQWLVHPLAGKTPLHAAVDAGYPQIVQLLLKAGADIEASSGPDSQWTPLQHAAFGVGVNQRSAKEARAILRILLDNGAEVRAAAPGSGSSHRDSALSIAAWLADPEDVALLLAHGAAQTVDDLLEAMHSATVDNGYRNLPTLWAYGRRRLSPPLRLIEVLPHVNGAALRILLEETDSIPTLEPLSPAELNEADPVTGETPLAWVIRNVRVEESSWGMGFRYDQEDVTVLLRHGADPAGRLAKDSN